VHEKGESLTALLQRISIASGQLGWAIMFLCSQTLQNWRYTARQRSAARLMAQCKLAAWRDGNIVGMAFEQWARLPTMMKMEREQQAGEEAALAKLKQWLVDYRCGTTADK
jgi:hypothetical protein